MNENAKKWLEIGGAIAAVGFFIWTAHHFSNGLAQSATVDGVPTYVPPSTTGAYAAVPSIQITPNTLAPNQIAGDLSLGCGCGNCGGSSGGISPLQTWVAPSSQGINPAPTTQLAPVTSQQVNNLNSPLPQFWNGSATPGNVNSTPALLGGGLQSIPNINQSFNGSDWVSA